jgi:plastocyanin
MAFTPPARPAAAASALLLAAGVALAACSNPSPAAGSGDSIKPGAGQSALAGTPGSSGTGSPAASTMHEMTSGPGGASTSPPAAVPVSGSIVMIKNFAFGPAALQVKVGTKVTWQNQDTDPHTVTSTSNSGPLASAALSTGQRYSFTFTKPGTYTYLCTIHPFMTATVTVTP